MKLDIVRSLLVLLLRQTMNIYLIFNQETLLQSLLIVLLRK